MSKRRIIVITVILLVLAIFLQPVNYDTYSVRRSGCEPGTALPGAIYNCPFIPATTSSDIMIMGGNRVVTYPLIVALFKTHGGSAHFVTSKLIARSGLYAVIGALADWYLISVETKHVPVLAGKQKSKRKPTPKTT